MKKWPCSKKKPSCSAASRALRVPSCSSAACPLVPTLVRTACLSSDSVMSLLSLCFVYEFVSFTSLF